MKQRLSLFLICIAGVFTPLLAHGQVSAAADAVAGSLLMSAFGGGGFLGIVTFLRDRIFLLLLPVGIFLVVRAGVKLINSQDDEKLNVAKRTIAGTAVGIMLAYLSARLVDAFVTVGGTLNPNAGANILAEEVAGIIDWVSVLVAGLAILMIVVSGLQAITSFGKEESTTKVRNTIFGVVAGIGTLIIAPAIKLTLGLTPDATASLPGSPDASPIILRGVQIVSTLLTFLALIAVAVIIYAGIVLIGNFGNEEQFTKSKSLIVRALIGLIVILLSVVIVQFVVDFFI